MDGNNHRNRKHVQMSSERVSALALNLIDYTTGICRTINFDLLELIDYLYIDDFHAQQCAETRGHKFSDTTGAVMIYKVCSRVYRIFILKLLIIFHTHTVLIR